MNLTLAKALAVAVAAASLGSGVARADEPPPQAPLANPQTPVPPVPNAPAPLPSVYEGTVDESATLSDRASRHPFTAGIDVYFGPGSFVADAPGVLFAPTLTLGYTPTPHVTLGVNGLTFGFRESPDGVKTAFTAGPYVEVYSFLRGTTQAYAQLGVPLEVRFDAPRDSFAYAPYAGLGLRFWIAPTFSLGLGTRLQIAGSPTYQTGNAVLSRGDVAWAFGPSFDVHL